MPAGTVRKSDPLFKRIRLLRKKLKQIENLKLLSRKLNVEEVAKIERQDEFRDELLDLLTEQNEQTQQDSLLEDATVRFSDEEDNNQPSLSEEESLSEEHDESPRTSSADSRSSSQHDSITPCSASTAGSSTQISRSPKHKLVSAGGQGEPAPAPQEPPLKRMRKAWGNRYFDITELTGHTDIVRAVDVNAEHIVSASRDTSVKLWNCMSGEFILNFGGHTNQVNCVKLLQLSDGSDYKSVVVSGSEDCTVRFWDISSGKQLKEFYMFNTVTCLAAMMSTNCLIAGLDGGKLEVFDLKKLSAPVSHAVDTAVVTSLSVEGNLLAVGGSDGLVEVLEIIDGTFRRLFALEHQQLTGSVKSIHLHEGQIIVGDDEANVKNIHWKQNRITAIANHHSEFGVTDALCCVGSCLLSSAYDYDAGNGFLNVRDTSLHKYDYLSSISDPDVLHILSIAAMTTGDTCSGPLTVVTGGIQLVLWKEDLCRTVDSVRCKPRKLVLADDQLSSESDDYGEESEQSESESTDSEPSNWWCTLL